MSESSGKRDRIDLRAAWIAALAGLAGALVGGLATYVVNVQSENRADDRVEQADARLARGVARTLQARYDSAGTAIQVMLDRGGYFLAPPLTDELSHDDKRHLASTVSAAAWEEIAEAEANLRSLVTLIQVTPEEQRQVTPDDRENLEAAQEDLAEARAALDRVTD